MTRAKYRCLSITHHLTGTTVELKPVIGKSQAYPGGSEENLAYFKATPTGEATLRYRVPPAEVPFKVGDYYFIHIKPREDGHTERAWKLWRVEHTETAQTVVLSLGWDQSDVLTSADFNACIENRDVWPLFAGKSGTHWMLSITEAPTPVGFSYP
jgi:hypothetical protein